MRTQRNNFEVSQEIIVYFANLQYLENPKSSEHPASIRSNHRHYFRCGKIPYRPHRVLPEDVRLKFETVKRRRELMSVNKSTNQIEGE